METADYLRGRRRQELTAEEKAELEAIVSPPIPIGRRTIVTRAGEPVHQATMLLSGFMCRYMDARDGQRQLVSIQVPGDFVDLHGYPLRCLDHDIGTLTDCEVGTVPHDRLAELIGNRPHLTRLMWFSTLLDAAMHREWIFRLGRLDAASRVAHLLCETYARLFAVGHASGGSFAFPLTQQDLGEACGLTNVHVNRTLRRLREDGLASVSDGHVDILDWRGLTARAEFSPDYLYLKDSVRDALVS